MIQKYNFSAVALLIMVLVALVGTSCSEPTQDTTIPLVTGLDHVPIAVKDLEGASEQYRKIGFTLKPGRRHENGIQNQHIKFQDGTEIELITASEASDPLSAEYENLIESGEGPAFLGFFAPDMAGLEDHFKAEGKTYLSESGLLTFPESDELHYIFFGSRMQSDSDQPEHFKHPNGANGLIGAWIAGDNLESEHDLLVELGATITEEVSHTPEKMRASVARLPDTKVVFLPAARQLIPERRIVGITIRTGNLDTLLNTLLENHLGEQIIEVVNNEHSIFLPPGTTHGLWLEFRE